MPGAAGITSDSPQPCLCRSEMSLKAQQNPSAGLRARGPWCTPQYRVALAPGSSFCCCLGAVKEPVSSYGVIQLAYRVTAQLKKMCGAVHCAILELRIIGNFLWCWCGGIRLPVLIALLRSSSQCSKQAVQQRLCQHLAVCVSGKSNLLVQGGFWLSIALPLQTYAAIPSA